MKKKRISMDKIKNILRMHATIYVDLKPAA